MSQSNNTTGDPQSSTTGFNPGHRSGRNSGRGGRNRGKWNRNKNTKNNFVGKTKEMHGHVFQLQVERRQKGQFQDTVEQLQVYASSTYKKDIKHLKILFTQLELPNIVKPTPPTSKDAMDQLYYQEEMKQHIKDKKNLETTIASLYNVVCGQCSKLLQNKLKARNNFDQMDDSCNVATLLSEIKTLSSKIEESTSAYDALHEAKAKFFKYQQSEDETLADHMRNFKDLCNAVEYHGGDIFFDKEMVKAEVRGDSTDKASTTTNEEYRTRVIDKSKAVAFLKSANRKTYGKLLSTIRDQFSFKIDVYPKTLSDAYEMLSAHTPHNSSGNKNKKENKNTVNNTESDNRENNTTENARSVTETGTSYLQSTAVPGSDGRLIPHITCYNCGKKGHYADNCPTQVCTPVNEEQHVQMNNSNSSEHQEEDDSDVEQQHLQTEGTDDNTDIIHFSWTQVNRYKGLDYTDTDILLDTGSTFSVFKNPDMVLNIRNSGRKLKAYTNGGRQDSAQVADLPGFFTVWFNPSSMINILSWADVRSKYRITADTAVGNYITVHLSPKRQMRFQEVASGLYLFRNKAHIEHNNRISGYSYLMLTEAKLKNFSKEQIVKADKARELYRALGFPGHKRFLEMLKNNKIPESNVSFDDAKRALHIYGTEPATIKGKTTKDKQSKIECKDSIRMPAQILKKNNKVHLMVDYMFIQGIQFLTTISHEFKFRTAEPLPYTYKKGAKKVDIWRGIQKVIKLYESRGLVVDQVHGDNEFECIREDLRPTLLNISAADEHVSMVERSIRTIKDRTRSVVQFLPYNRYPRNMIIGCVIFAVKSLNNEVGMTKLSDIHSPHALVTGQPPRSYKDVIAMTYGEYVEVYAMSPIKNNIDERTISAIALYPSGNNQGGWIFMSLNTGRLLHRNQWKKLSISQGIIDRVNMLGEKDGQQTISNNFRYRVGKDNKLRNIEDESSVRSRTSNENESDDESITSLVEFHEIADEINDIAQDDEDEVIVETCDDVVNDEEHGVNDNTTDETEGVLPDEITSNVETQDYDQPAVLEEHIHEPDNNDDEDLNSDHNSENSHGGESQINMEDNEGEEPNDETVAKTEGQRYNLRSRSKVNYMDMHKYGETQLLQIQNKWINDQVNNTATSKVSNKKVLNLKTNDIYRRIVGVTLTQLSKEDKYAQVSVKEGIKRHGNKAIAAVLSEFSQLNDKHVFRPRQADELTNMDKKQSLNLITMIKEKRDGKIKGRACADGRKQRRYINRDDVSSPTVQLESLMISLLIDAHEHRDVATADIVGAYLLADIQDFVLVKITGETVDIMCRVNESFKQYVVMEKGKRTLYLQLTKALYGCMQSALLWYETLKNRLLKMGFELNQYDPCVANKIVNGKQCTICWYVDDTKISHEDSSVVDMVIRELEEEFGKMTVTRGHKHTFVGVDIEFNNNGTVSLSMDEYVNECIKLYEDSIKRTAATPAKGDLFDDDIGKDGDKLDQSGADKFHHTTAKLLYLAKRVRIDIDLAISFLCTRVAEPTVGDENKLKRVLSYLQGTKTMKRVMGTNGMNYIQTWIDASYAIHRDMRGHTGGIISMGKGTLIHNCSKQKLNTKSSTESEVVGVSDFLPYTIWASYFLKAQGYELQRNIFYQDNTSAIKMLKNGKESCGSKSRHIHIRYFFTKDVLKREDMEIVHCNTDKMIADFYTKPLQGKHFYQLRNIIMGHSSLPVEECVEGSNEMATDKATKSYVNKQGIKEQAVDKTHKYKARRNTMGLKYKVSNNFN